jgi:hypothetical protein
MPSGGRVPPPDAGLGAVGEWLHPHQDTPDWDTSHVMDQHHHSIWSYWHHRADWMDASSSRWHYPESVWRWQDSHKEYDDRQGEENNHWNHQSHIPTVTHHRAMNLEPWSFK